MLKEKYLTKIKTIIKNFNLNKNSKKLSECKFFIFGSSIKKEKFNDVDIGIIGDIDKKKLIELKEIFQKSTLPYKVDIIKIDETSKAFKKNILDNKIIWIIP